jgi:hypothetical protein
LTCYKSEVSSFMTDKLFQFFNPPMSENEKKVWRDKATTYRATDVVKKRKKSQDLKRRYGVTTEWFDRCLHEQAGGCAICSKPFGDKKPNLPCVDHNHGTKKVRGLLCMKCNAVIGHANEDIIILQNAISYLNNNK